MVTKIKSLLEKEALRYPNEIWISLIKESKASTSGREDQWALWDIHIPQLQRNSN